MLRYRKFIISLALMGSAHLFLGCATEKEELGAEIREALGVTKDTVEKTENLAERNYDPQVILKRGEAYYESELYTEAAGEYRHFIDLHPLHQWADYALFKLGMSYFHQIRTIDRDPEPTQNALESFQKLTSLHPSSKYVEAAAEKITICRKSLAEHQIYVGRFYFKKSSYPAAIKRFKNVLELYPDLNYAEEALYYLGLTYYRYGDPDEAKVYLNDLLGRYPKSPHREPVQQLLAQIRGAPPQ